MILSRKAESLEPSLTLKITSKVKELKKNGIDVMDFGVGEPDFNTPENIRDKAIEAINNGYTRYTQVSGIVELKTAISKKFKRDNNLNYDISQIIVSTGAKQCLANAFSVILNPGDEVLISKPYWVSYPELVKLSDGVPVFIDADESSNYKYTKENLNKALTSKTKAILLNSPSNPTGTIYELEDLKIVYDFAKENDLLIISDEIYEKLIYNNKKHISIANLNEDAFMRTIVINGVSKSYAMTGWRIGYAASGNTKIIKLMDSIQSHVTSNPSTICQYAALEALEGEQGTIDKMVSEFEKRKDFLVSSLEKMKDISFIKPEGAFYAMINVSKYYDKEFNGKIIKNSLDFATLLLEEGKAAVVPGIAFGDDRYIRFSYANSMENICKGLEELSKVLANMK